MYQNWRSHHLPRATDNVFRLVSFLYLSFFYQWIVWHLFYDPSEYFAFANRVCLRYDENFQIWQIFTHPFFHSNVSFLGGLINVFFSSLVLYFFASDLERTWGPYHFLKFFLFAIFGSLLLGFFVSFIPGQKLLYHGIAGGNAGVLIAYAMFWPKRQILFMFVFPMQMKWFILLLFAYLALSGGSAHLIQYSGGALAAMLFLYYYARKGRNAFAYSRSADSWSLPSIFVKIQSIWEQKKNARRMAKKRMQIEKRIDMKYKVDELLEKISKEGMDSLSAQEKKFLDQASKEL